MGVGSTTGMVVAALAGGLVGAVVLVFAYFVGIALIGAGLGALIAHIIWTQVTTADPPALVIVVMSIAGAMMAMWLQRYVIIIGTAFGGAWTVIVGAVNAFAARGITRGASATEVWILYPTSVGEQRWAPLAWIVLGLAGTAVQLALTGRKK
jgi:uncharacterized protein DUF4203